LAVTDHWVLRSILIKFLLEEAKFSSFPFYAFGSVNNGSWFRLSVGTSKTTEMRTVIRALRQALEHFRPAPEI
jgi:hypothetical protein